MLVISLPPRCDSITVILNYIGIQVFIDADYILPHVHLRSRCEHTHTHTLEYLAANPVVSLAGGQDQQSYQMRRIPDSLKSHRHNSSAP